MLYVFHGEDEFSRQQALDELKKGIGDATALATNMAVLEGAQVTLENLRGACETMPFLAAQRLVIIHGMLERFEPRSKPSRKKTRLETAESEYQSFATYFGQVPDFTILVLVDGKIGNQNPLLKELSKSKAVIKAFPVMRTAALRQWIEKRVAGQGGKISPQATDLLARFVGSDLRAMANEIDKLSLFAAGRRIEEPDVRLLVSDAQEANVFAMVDAILESRAVIAQELLQKLLDQGAAPTYLLVMITRQARVLVRMKELAKQGLSAIELQSRLGLSADFLVRKATEQAGKYSLERLAEVYRRLLEADIAIKTGYDGELALNILVAELCQGTRAATSYVH
ncbi:MAG: DNA polymerase III subunit delta [Dehalococcoidales bacterium]|nr:DNA polymerase III subunit delta [Dehalococcoidales bacterium]